jgi:hypothetical protein
VGLILGVTITVIFVLSLLLIIGLALYRYYYGSSLQHLPSSISWSFLDKLTHPWRWEYIYGYYQREYTQGIILYYIIMILFMVIAVGYE